MQSIQTRLLEKPSLLREVCDEIHRASTMQNMHSVPSDLSCRQGFKRAKCSCRRSMYAVEWDYDSWQLRLMCYGGLVGRVVQASMQLRRGAGGFSISPSLDCFRLVPAHSPAFQSPWFFADINPQDDSLPLHYTAFIALLERAFQKGQASPHDVTPSGQTLLHVSPATCCRFNFGLD